MITSLDHIHIHAADPLATIRFYESCLGAEHLGSIPSGEGGRNHGVLLGGQLLVISEFPPGMTPAEPPEAGAGALRSGF
ncbi:MAG: VOC family protein, partial [Deltaproteobacteria bacterium]|nr:VOC family protein [Deltaproteobacteria bacterium]